MFTSTFSNENQSYNLVYSSNISGASGANDDIHQSSITTESINAPNEQGNKEANRPERPKQLEESFYDEDSKVHYYEDGHYWFEVPGLESTENAILSPSERLPPGCYKKPGKLKFSTGPMKQFSTYAVDDYDRRNDDVDPVAASGKDIFIFSSAQHLI